MKKLTFGILVLVVALIGHISYETGKQHATKYPAKFYDGEGNSLPDSVVKLMVLDHYCWLTTPESTYLANYALLDDTASRGGRYTNPLGDSGENKPIMPNKSIVDTE